MKQRIYMEAGDMLATVQKRGNSSAIRIPKKLLDSAGLKENDKVEILQIEGGFSVSKSNSQRSFK